MNTQLASSLTTRALADNQVVTAATKTPYWVAIAAALLTTTTLAVLTVGNANAKTAPEQINGISVVDLPAVQVYAETAARESLNVVTLAAIDVYADATQNNVAEAVSPSNFVHHSLAPQLQRMGSAGLAEGFSLLNSQLAMPYYSFGKALSSSSKE